MIIHASLRIHEQIYAYSHNIASKKCDIEYFYAKKGFFLNLCQIKVMKSLTKEQICSRFLAARKKVGFSQKELAKALNTTQSTISRMEKGEIEPSASMIPTISNVTGNPIEYFLTDDLPQERLSTAKAMGEIIDSKDSKIEYLKALIESIPSDILEALQTSNNAQFGAIRSILGLIDVPLGQVDSREKKSD